MTNSRIDINSRVIPLPYDFIGKVQNQRLIDNIGKYPRIEVGSGPTPAPRAEVGSGPITPEQYNSMYYPNLQHQANQTIAAQNQPELGSGPITPQAYEKMHPDVFKKRLNYGMYFQ